MVYYVFLGGLERGELDLVPFQFGVELLLQLRVQLLLQNIQLFRVLVWAVIDILNFLRQFPQFSFHLLNFGIVIQLLLAKAVENVRRTVNLLPEELRP